MDWASFCVGGEELVVCSQNLKSNWQWEWRDSVHANQKVGGKYLALRNDVCFEGNGGNTQDEKHEGERDEELICDDDDKCAFEKGREEFIFIEYHILFSEVYSCPVLYFQPRFQDGHVMNHSEVWKFLSLDEKSPGNTVTQAEHPGTGFPFFFVHPCRTPQVMGAILPSQKTKEVHYLVCWLSLVGPVTRLKVPAEIATIFPMSQPQNEEDNEEI